MVFGQHYLSFVGQKRHCFAGGSALRCRPPSLGVSSLDLGRLPTRAPFILLRAGHSAAARYGRSPWIGIAPRRSAKVSKIGRERGEGRGALVAPLIHVERPVDLQLDDVQADGRVAVMTGAMERQAALLLGRLGRDEPSTASGGDVPEREKRRIRVAGPLLSMRRLVICDGQAASQLRGRC